jgi:predicted nucleic acid-binding protein
MRVLCDTNVLARAATRPGGPAQELMRRLLNSPNHVLVLTPFLLDELTRVLAYSRIRLRATASAEEIARFLDDLERAAELVEPPAAPPRAVTTDPADDPIVAGAVQGHIDVLCTRDRHFHKPAVITFCADRNVRILDDVELLAELRQGESTA